MSTKKAGKLNSRLLSSLSGCLPDELLRRNFELNVDFVVLADLDPVNQRSDDHSCVPVNHLPLNILYQKYFHLQQKLLLAI